MSKLPNGWREAALGEVSIVLSGGTPSTKNSEYWEGNISWITPKDLSGYNARFIERGKYVTTHSNIKIPKITVVAFCK